MSPQAAPSQTLLIIGWRDGKRYKLGRVDTEKSVTDYLAALVAAEEARLSQSKARAYSVESTIEAGEYFVAETAAPDEEEALRAQLRSIGGLPLVTVDRLEKTSLSFYAAVVGTEAAQIKAFIKKTNPLMIAKGGGLLTVFGDALSRLERPVFTIAGSFDLIVYPDCIAILKEKPFQALFYEETGINASIGGWVDKIARNLPMEDAAKTKLVGMCQKAVRLRQKLQAIEERGHLANVTVARLRSELRRLNIPPDRFITKGKLVIPDKHEKQLLEVLNEDIFKGGLSGEDFAAERKSRATID